MNVQVQRPMFGSGFISSSTPSENDSRGRPHTSLMKKTTSAALPSISGSIASNETKSWKESASGNNQIFERVKTTASSNLTVNSEAPVSQPNQICFSDTNNEQTSQSTRCDTDANTSYSRSNFGVHSTLPPITTTSSQDDLSVPNNFNPFSSANPETDYTTSISRKNSTKNEQTSQSTGCDTDANTSYSQSNFGVQPTLPPITTSTSSRDNWSVPNNLNPFSSANPTTDYNSSISRKTFTQHGVTHEDVFGDPQDKTLQVIANTKIVTPRTMQPSVQQPTERPVSVPRDESLSSHDDDRDWRDLAKLCCCCFFE